MNREIDPVKAKFMKVAKTAGEVLLTSTIIGFSLKGVGCTSINNENISKTIQVENIPGKEQLIEQVALSELLDHPENYAGRMISVEGIARFMGEGAGVEGYRLFEQTPENLRKVNDWDSSATPTDSDPAYKKGLEKGRYLDFAVKHYRTVLENSGTLHNFDFLYNVPLIKSEGFNKGIVRITGFIERAAQEKNYAVMSLENPQTDKLELIKKIE
jgi:hypothetical protein